MEEIYFTGCLTALKDINSNIRTVNWYDGTIKTIDINSFVFVLKFDESIYDKYKYILENNPIKYLSLTKILNEGDNFYQGNIFHQER